MPLYRRLPKRGFNPIRRDKIAKINLDLLNKLLDSNKISSSTQGEKGLAHGDQPRIGGDRIPLHIEHKGEALIKTA